MTEKQVAQRRCMMCRQHASTDRLHRFVRANDGEIVFDKSRRLGLRGTWICADGSCLNRIANKSPFERAFKKPVIVDVESLKLNVRCCVVECR